MRSLTNVEYRGQVSPEEAADVIANSAVLLSTSDEEGFPNTFTQAWASGTPTVSLTVDPDRIIERVRLGAVSGSIDTAITDLNVLINSTYQRQLIADRALRYISEAHSETAVIRVFERALLHQDSL
jgi:glycosyltransferase involved in cell wall biosynthesis